MRVQSIARPYRFPMLRTSSHTMIGSPSMGPAGTSRLIIWRLFKRSVNSGKAFQDKYIGSFFHSLKNLINP